MLVSRASIDDFDIEVTGPGYTVPEPGVLIGVVPDADGSPLQATYSVTGPDGSWDLPDNGLYTVSVTASEVLDTSGNAVAAGVLGTFNVNVVNMDYLGTPGDDTFEVKTKDGGTALKWGKLNGVPFTTNATIVNFYGLDGNDTAQMSGASTGGGHTATGVPDSLELVRADYEFHVYDVEVARAYSRVAGDVAYLTGSAGDDTFQSKETYSYLKGPGYNNIVNGFSYVEASVVTTDGSRDAAYVYDSNDSATGDKFSADPTAAQMDRGNDGSVEVSAAGFDVVKAFAAAGAGVDEAYLLGSDGDDRFESKEAWSVLKGSGFYNYAAGFDFVQGDVSADTGSDTAYLYDSVAPADDTFAADPFIAEMDRGTTGTVNARAIGFDLAKAYAPGGGNDEAYLAGDPAGDDTLYSYQTYSYLKGAGFYNYANGFDYVAADASGGATDRDVAYLYDSNDPAAGDKFTADSAGAQMDRGDDSTVELSVAAFDVVKAYARTGAGVDEAYLMGSAGDDTFENKETYSLLKGAGFYNYAAGFDYVEGDGGGAGSDTAYMYDSVAAADDTFTADSAGAEMDRGTTGSADAKATGFGLVKAYAAGGGHDEAYLTGDPAGDDTLYSYQTYSYLKGAGFYNYANGFDYVAADATGGATDRDVAYLYDSNDPAASDKFTADPAGAQMDRGNDGSVETAVVGFEVAKAYATTGTGADEAYLMGSPGDDTFENKETYSLLKSAGFYNYAARFDYVEGDGGGAGSDTAYMYDSVAVADDTFSADPAGAEMDRGTTGTADAKAIGFDLVKAYATGGGHDEAYLTGDPTGDDTLYSYETYGYLKGAGFYNYANGFDYVAADATGGATDRDVAYLYDSNDPTTSDKFTADPAGAQMDRGNDGPIETAVMGFQVVKAYATAGTGFDQADLSDSSGDDRFFAYPTYAYLKGTGFYNYTRGFDRVEAAASTSGSDVDRAYLYDSDGDDTFDGHSTTNYGEMFYAAGNSAQATDFEYGWAIAPVDYPDNDTANLYSGTVWQASGDWETINNLGPGAGGLDLGFANWIATMEDAEATGEDAQEVDPAGVDEVFTLLGS